MNVADLELCKELYELSGWMCGVVHHDVSEVDVNGNIVEHHWGIFGEDLIVVSTKNPPAYDLGYLLRKLPFELPNGSQPLQLVHDDDRNKGVKGWVCGYLTIVPYGDEAFYVIACEAGTPEDAACKLAVKLFKQGILTKGDK